MRKNGFTAASGCDQEKRALPEVIQHQRRQDDREPGEPNRRGPKVADVGVKRFAAGDREEYRAQDHETAASRCSMKNSNAVERIDRAKHFRRAADLVDPEER